MTVKLKKIAIISTSPFILNFFFKNHVDFLAKKYEVDVYTNLKNFSAINLENYQAKFINLGISCEYVKENVFYGYHLYPRSSISKTKVRLANSVGIIDPNYRGNIIAAVDNICNEIQILKQGERYFQLVFVRMDKLDKVEIVEELTSSDRANNGFGSTGK